jgi:hypothetical protein
MASVYNYHPETGVYLTENTARLDPIDGNPMVPAHATLQPPPATAANQIAVWESDAWTLKSDFRGHEYWLADGSRTVIAEIGDQPPEGALNAPPPPTLDQIKANARGWVIGWINAVTAQVTDKYARDEVAAFGSKREDAARHLAGEDATGLLVEEAALTGETTQELAQSILDNNARYVEIIAKFTGARRVAFAAIQTASGGAEVETALEYMRSTPTTIANEMGLLVPEYP